MLPKHSVPKTLEEIKNYAAQAEIELLKVEEFLKYNTTDTVSRLEMIQAAARKSLFIGALTLPFVDVPDDVKELAKDAMQKLFDHLNQILTAQESECMHQSPWIYREGMFQNSRATNTNHIKALSWNVCFLDGELPLIFGGVLTWKDRIDAVAARIKDLALDLICLQEVFSAEANEALYEKLKEDFQYFYMHIGAKEITFDLSNLIKLPTGLFVASKIPLKDPLLYLFDPDANETQTYRGYGIFQAKIFDKLWIVNTHMQPGTSDEDRQIRHNQVNALVKVLKRDYPAIIFADTNIDYKSVDYKSWIQPLFFDHVTKGANDWTCCELNSFWTNPARFSSNKLTGGLYFEYIDAILQSKCMDQMIKVDAEVLPSLFDLEPMKALSDHRALLSMIYL